MSAHPQLPAQRRTPAILAGLILCLFSTPGAHAQDEGANPLALPSVVVSATRLPTPESEIASSVTVITAQEMEQKQERTVVDALEDVPGLNVIQTGGPGETASVYMRGMAANAVKVLIDGIDVSDPSSADGSFNFGNLLTSDIARIEILRGPQSGLYGADASGGVINIITKTGSGPAKLTGSLEGGSFGTFNQTAGASGSQGRFNYDFNVAHYHDNDMPVTPVPLVAPGRQTNDDSYDNTTVSTKLGAKLTDNFDVGLVARYDTTNLQFTQDDALGPEALLSTGTTQQIFTRGTAHLSLFDGRFDQTLGLAYTGYQNHYWDPNAAAIAGGGDPSDYHGGRIKLDWQGNVILLPGQVLVLGAEHQLDTIATSTPLSAQVTNDAGYIQLQSSFAGRLFDTVSLRYDQNGQFGGKATYRFAPAYLIPETGTKFKGSVGTGFNPPSLVELYESFPAFDFFADPDLRPETSLGYDGGFEQSVWDKRIQFGSTYFHNNINNLISLNSTGTSYENIGQATTYGAENFVSVQPWKPLKLRADYTYTIADDDILHQELIRRPKNKASLNATWQATPKLSLSATLLYVGSWIDVNRDATATGIPVNGYTLVNLAASYDLGHGVTAFTRIDNLLDRQYQDPLGYQRPGLGVFAGLRVAFDVAGAGK